MPDDVDRIVLDAIDEALSVLGSKGRDSVYYFLEREYLLKKEDVPLNLRRFDDCLRMVFGLGANLLEKHIINTLKRRVGVELEADEGLDFVETLETIKSIIRKRILMI